MYKLTAYTLDGAKYTEIRSKSLEFLERFKNKKHFRVVIKEGRRIVYTEVRE